MIPPVAPALLRTLAATFPGIDPEVDPRDEMFQYSATASGAVAGISEYFALGALQQRLCDDALAWLGCSAGAVAAAGILDFASGFGRLTRQLVHRVEPGAIWVADIQEQAVTRQRARFGVNGFVSAWTPEAVVFPRRFGWITVISLFTHLPAAKFTGWLRALAGALAPGGAMLFTTSGPHAYQQTFGRELTDEFVFERESESSRLDRDEYGRTWCTRAFVEREVAATPGVTLLAHVPRGLNDHQDVVLIGRDRPAPATPFEPSRPPQVQIDVAREVMPKTLRIEGWALQGSPPRPAARVEVWLEDRPLGAAEPGRQRPDLAAALAAPAARGSGWLVQPRVTAPPEYVAVRAIADDGGSRVRIAAFPAVAGGSDPMHSNRR